MSDHGDDDDVDDEELADLAGELSDVLGDLRDELRAGREGKSGPPAGSGGRGEPSGESGGRVEHRGGEVTIDLPSASDLLAFADERLIPGAIAVLEANITALRLLQKGIRLARPDRRRKNAEALQSRAESLSRSTLERLDDTLADLQEAAREGSLPRNDEARDVIEEARRLREELDEALERRADERDAEGDHDAGEANDGSEGAAEEASDPWGLDDQPEVDVDVEGELESIKAELGKVDEDEQADDESEDPDDRQDSPEGMEARQESPEDQDGRQEPPEEQEGEGESDSTEGSDGATGSSQDDSGAAGSVDDEEGSNGAGETNDGGRHDEPEDGDEENGEP